MVEENVKLRKLFIRFEDDVLKDKKRFALSELEDFLIDKSGGVSNYELAGAYQGLYTLLKSMEKEGELVSIKSSPFNSRQPALKSRWQLNKSSERAWGKELIFKLSRRLNISYFLKRPVLQTEELVEKLINLHRFLGNKDEREWASREERSLELFGNEKYLSGSEGKKLLSRLKLSLADIKAEKYSQMFVYWNKGNAIINRILILENHSAFIACKRAVENDYSIFNFDPDTLIYGEGKHIIDSLKFLDEISDNDNIIIKYAGDIDPEGIAIYTLLRKRYPEFCVKLHIAYYEKMLESNEIFPIKKSQNKNEELLNGFLIAFKERGKNQSVEIIQKLWQSNLRIPQEVISYEFLKNSWIRKD